MPRKIYKNIIWLWLISLFVSTAGVSVKTIYCYCAGGTVASIFEPQNKCHHSEKTAAAKSCCQEKQTEKCDSPQILEGGKNCCTKTGSKFFKLKTEFESPEFSFKIFDFQAVVPVLPSLSLARFFTKNFPPLHFCVAEPPPGPPGKTIRLRLGSWLN